MLFAVLVVLPVAILQLGTTQQCSCTTGIAVIPQDDLKKEIRAEVAAALAENGVVNITNTIQQAVNATVGRAMEDINTEIGQLVAPLLAQLKHLQLPGKTPMQPPGNLLQGYSRTQTQYSIRLLLDYSIR